MDRPPERAVLRLQGVTKVDRMGEVEVHALRGVDFELFEGELAVLLGPSGSGKSTLLNILGALDVGAVVVLYPSELIGDGVAVEVRRSG